MTHHASAAPAKPVFGRRREPHTIIIAHGDEVSHFTIKPWLTFSFGAVVAAMLVGYLLATSYLVFRDDLIGASIARQARMQQTYEDRIAALRAQVDRITSRQLLDQQIMESKVAELIDRQEQLSTRGERLGPLLERARANGSGLPVPSKKPATGQLGYSGDVMPSNFIGNLFSSKKTVAENKSTADQADAVFASITHAIREVESTQLAELRGLADDAQSSAVNIKKVLTKAGLPVSAQVENAVGGPYIPASEGEKISVFDAEVERLDSALDELDLMKKEVRRHPVGNPVPGSDVTSRFGYRKDPLLGSQAFHAGIDFRGEIGRPVKAPAAGVVVKAGRSGGYGNLVEILHPNGMSTRYGHLSAINVSEGEKVQPGKIIGKIGNTGRSTGPHLHYEIRVNGNPVDASRYLSVGNKIAPLL